MLTIIDGFDWAENFQIIGSSPGEQHKYWTCARDQLCRQRATPGAASAFCLCLWLYLHAQIMPHGLVHMLLGEGALQRQSDRHPGADVFVPRKDGLHSDALDSR